MSQRSDAERGPSPNAFNVTLTDTVAVRTNGLFVLIAREAKAANATLYYNISKPTLEGDTGRGDWSGWYRFDFPEHVPTAPSNTRRGEAGPPPELRVAGMDLITVTKAAMQAAPADAPFRVVAIAETLYCFRPATDGTVYLNRLRVIEQRSSNSDEADTTPERGDGTGLFDLEQVWEPRFRASGQKDVPSSSRDSQSVFSPNGPPFVEPTIQLTTEIAFGPGGFDVAVVPTGDINVNRIYLTSIIPDAGKQVVKLWRLTVHEGGQFDVSELGSTTVLAPTMSYGGGAAAELTPLSDLAPALAFYWEQDIPVETAAATPGDGATSLQDGRLALAIPVGNDALGLKRAMAIYDFGIKTDGSIPAKFEQPALLVDGTLADGKFHPDDTSGGFPTPAQSGQTVHVTEGLVVSALVLGQIEPHRTPMMLAGSDGLLHLYFGGPLAPETESEESWGGLVPGQPRFQVAQYNTRAQRLVIDLNWRDTVPSERTTGTVRCVARRAGPSMNETTVAVAAFSAGEGTAAAGDQSDLCTVTINYGQSAVDLPTETWHGVPRELRPFLRVMNGGAIDLAGDPRVKVGRDTYFDATGNFNQVRISTNLTPSGDTPGANGQAPYAAKLTLVSRRTDIQLRSAHVTGEAADRGTLKLTIGTDNAAFTLTFADLPRSVTALPDILNGSDARYRYAANPADPPLTRLTTRSEDGQDAILFYPIPGEAADPTPLRVVVVPNLVDRSLCTAKFSKGELVAELTDIPRAQAGFIAAVSNHADWANFHFAISPGPLPGNVEDQVAEGPIDLSVATMLFDALLPVEGLNATIQNDDYVAIRQSRKLSSAPPPAAASERGMLGLYALLGSVPESGGDQYIELTNGSAATVTGSTPIWQRRAPTYQLTFDGTNRMNVPTEVSGHPTPSLADLTPGMDWTIEAWVKPGISDTSQLATFHATPAKAVPGQPTQDFALATSGSRSLEFGAVKNNPPDRRSSYLLTDYHSDLLLKTSFTWEFWVQPQANPAPNVTDARNQPLGYALMVITEDQVDPNFSVGLNKTRQVVVRYWTSDFTQADVTSKGAIASTSSAGDPEWTHVAVVVVRPPAGTGQKSTLSILINGVIDRTDEIPLGDFSTQVAQAYIGGVGNDDASLAGLMAAMRFWVTARSVQQIRTAAFQNVRPDETGLAGLWSLDADETVNGDIVFRNLAQSTYPNLNAIVVNTSNQEWKLSPNRFLLSFAAGIAGAPVEVGNMVLRTNRWNHVAAVYRAGGALNLLKGGAVANGAKDFNFAMEENPATFGLTDRFAVDAWVQISALAIGTDNTIIARWAREEDGQEFELYIDGTGALSARIVIEKDVTGTTMIVQGSGGAEYLKPPSGGYPVCHVAAVLELTNVVNDGVTTATWELELRIDNVPVFKKKSDPEKSATTRFQIRDTQSPLTVGMRKPPAEPWQKLGDGDEGFYQGVIGELRVWSVKPTWEQLFPERYRHVMPVANPPGLVARWSFREQQGLIAYDAVRDDNLKLSSPDLWTQLRVTSVQELYANGARIWNTEPANDLKYSTQNQFTLGQRAEGGQGLVGAMTEVRIWRGARTQSELSENMYAQLKGDEANLTAYWNFNDRTARDQTGGGNDANPAPAADRFKASDAPISNEGPEVFNVYGGTYTDFQVTTDIRPAVGEMVAATVDRDGVATGKMRRQYVYENPVASLPLPFKVGDLALKFIGQVQTDAKLIGYFEGAPPVPSENLTLPYYNSPTGAMRYVGSSQVKLIETAETSLTYANSASTTSNISAKASLGIYWKFVKGEVYGIGYGTVLQPFTVEGKFALTTAHEFKWGTGVDNTYNSAWTDRATDAFSVGGAWEPGDEAVLNPTVGRRFVPDNYGSALVESLVADSFAISDARTGAMLGVMLIPNLAIPPDRNIVTFPLKNDYTKQGTLDGKVGFVDDPSYDHADQVRGSYFKPAEAYRLKGEIEQSAARDQAFYRQFDAEGRGKTEFGDKLSGVTGNLPVDFAADTVRRGLVNSYVWSADGGFHSEEQSYLAKVSNTYKGFFNRTNQGGFDLESTFAFFTGFKGTLSFSGGIQVAVQVSATDQQSLAFGLTSTVVGESYLYAWDGKAYGADPAPGKVKAYRFMTFYEPPGEDNASNFRDIIDPVWFSRSTDAAAVVLRSADVSNPAWRVFHRVTYVERVPPSGSDQPVYSESNAARAPVNLLGNVALLALVGAEVGPVKPTPAQIGRALQRILNPAPDGAGAYPKAILENSVPWWGAFLTKARPGDKQDADAAKLLQRIFSNALVYVRDAYATGVVKPAVEIPQR